MKSRTQNSSLPRILLKVCSRRPKSRSPIKNQVKTAKATELKREKAIRREYELANDNILKLTKTMMMMNIA
jgi:hypothetical protein